MDIVECDKCLSRVIVESASECGCCRTLMCPDCTADLMKICRFCENTVCPLCRNNCSVCGSVVCEDCGLKTVFCALCGACENICPDCVSDLEEIDGIAVCHVCGVSVCSDCFIRCDVCDDPVCRNCAVACSFCGNRICPDCAADENCCEPFEDDDHADDYEANREGGCGDSERNAYRWHGL